LEQFGAVRSSLEQFGAVRSSLEQFGAVRSSLGAVRSRVFPANEGHLRKSHFGPYGSEKLV
jgi:hypothetical protein